MKKLIVEILWTEGKVDNKDKMEGSWDLATAEKKMKEHAVRAVGHGYFKTGVKFLLDNEEIWEGRFDIDDSWKGIKEQLTAEQDFAHKKLSNGETQENTIYSVKNMLAVLHNRTRLISILEVFNTPVTPALCPAL